MDLKESLERFKKQQEKCQVTLSSIAAKQTSSRNATPHRANTSSTVPAFTGRSPAAAPPVKFSSDTDRLQHINSIRKAPVGAQMKRVIDLLFEDFSDERAWIVLKDEPKWSQYFVKEINQNNPSSESAGRSKRSRSDVEGDTLNANSPTSGFSGHTIERPEGIMVAKHKGREAASTSCDQEDERAIEMVKIKDGWLSRAHELEMAKEARKREKQAHQLAMEKEQNKRKVFQQKWDLLQWMSAQTNLGEDGEVAKQKLFKELSNM